MRIKITKKSELPPSIRGFKELKGICIGECINKNNKLMENHAAHAHCFDDGFKGWICLRRKSQLRERLTLLHEVAHLIANTSPKIPFHGKKWKEAVVKIGGTYKSYRYIHGGYVHEYADYTFRNTKK